MMISINSIIFSNNICQVYRFHPWRHGYPPSGLRVPEAVQLTSMPGSLEYFHIKFLSGAWRPERAAAKTRPVIRRLEGRVWCLTLLLASFGIYYCIYFDFICIAADGFRPPLFVQFKKVVLYSSVFWIIMLCIYSI